MKRKRIVHAVVATTLVASMLAGCGGGSNNASEPKETSFKGSGEVNRFGWEKPVDTLEIDILDATGYYAPLEAQEVGEENSLKY